MTELFPVEVTAPHIPVAVAKPVVMHGTNKTGTLVLSDVIRHSYQASHREDQFYSVYHRSPENLASLARAMHVVPGHAFFVSHNIYGYVPIPSDALLIGQIRHPLPRTLSVYGWIKGKYLRRHRTLTGFPDLAEWLPKTNGVRHSLIAQFAAASPDGRPVRVAALSPAEAYARAVENVGRDFAWYGCADLFEESIFVLAHICGLKAVPPWHRDTRNQWRQKIHDTDAKTIDLINDIMSYDMKFYDYALKLFRSRLNAIEFGPSLDEYRRRCSAEYRERMTTPEGRE